MQLETYLLKSLIPTKFIFVKTILYMISTEKLHEFSQLKQGV